jgi:predicted PurR-regulated permease PerM
MTVSEPPLAPHPPLWRYAAITAVVLLTVGVAYLFLQARAVLVLIFLSFLLAAGLEPAVRWFTRRRVRRGAAVAIVCLTLAAVVTGMVMAGVVPAVRQFWQLVDAVPGVVADISEQVGDEDSTLGRYLARPEVQETLQRSLSSLPSLLTSSVGVIFGLLAKIAGGLFSVLTIAALTVYFMLALPRIVEGAAALLGNREWAAVMDEALGKIGGYVTGQLVICATAGVTAYVFFTIADVPYPALLAIGVAVLDLVPQVGATLGAVLGTAMALTVSVTVAVVTLIFFIAYQQFENYLLAPRIFARATALSPLSAFAAALIGGSAGGLVGAVAALPVAAALQVVIRYAFAARLDNGSSPAEPAADSA